MRLVLLFALAVGASAADTDPLAKLRFLEGSWEGTARGEPGKGVSKREFKPDVKGRFLSGRNRSVYEPKSPGAESEVHEDFSMYSYDRTAKKIVLRQFHSEGFVNEYALETSSEDGKRLDFVTVRIENIPPGWRAKESYLQISPDEYVETFSLAEPGKDFEVYSETRLKRVR